MEYKNLEQEYDQIFQLRVLPFIRTKLERSSWSVPAYHLLECLSINRFRSSLPIIIAREYGKDADMMLPLSAFCEMTFTTAMAEDDFFDGDDSREGLPAAHRAFGIEETLLSCAYVNNRMLATLNESLVGCQQRNAIMTVAVDAMQAWYLSVMMERKSRDDLLAVDEAYVKKLYLSKTVHGRMLLECVFLMVQDDTKILARVREYGEHLAIAGQLKNDIYDFTKHRQHRGLSDLRQGHITWPLFLLLGSIKRTEQEQVIRQLRDGDHESLIRAYRDARVIERTLDLIDHHVNQAKNIIRSAKMPKNVRDILESWAEGNRNFSREPKV